LSTKNDFSRPGALFPNRAPNFWRDMPLEQVKKEQAEGTALTKNFAWYKLPAADHIPNECMDKLLPGARLFK
jgi:hypothetical protein